MVREVTIRSEKRNQFIRVDNHLRDLVRDSGRGEGVITVFVPHTTAGITINENADPTVVLDIEKKAGELIPERDRYRHAEGNSDAHIKASFFGSSQSIIVDNGTLMLGTWQSVYFCEFDGPRTRRMLMRFD